MNPVIDTGVPMTTRDGVTLLADVYRPDGAGRWPTLVHRTPYDRTDPTLVAAIVADPLWLARQGFAVVVQDVRGRFGSGGTMDFANQEHDDGYDTVEWAATQPWSDGAVGVYGSSYHGITALNAVAAGPPHLRAALAMVGGADMETTSWPGGTLELGFLALYSLGQTLDTIARLPVDDAEKAARRATVFAALADPAATVGTLPLTAVPGLDDPEVARAWHERITNQPGDPYWRRPTVHADPSRVRVPLLQVVGYRDFLSPAMFTLAAALGADPRHRLVAGPWAHGGTYTGHTGARVLPGSPGGVGTWGPLIAAWFDVHLRGGTGAAHPAGARWLAGEPVHYYLGGQNRWATSTTWPPPGRPAAWHLAGHGRLLAPDGEPTADGADTWRADPHDPFPTCGGALSAPPLGPDGIQDQRVLDAREDVLRYTSAPLTDPVTLLGRPRLELSFASTAPDADVCVTLVDVEPSGFALPIAEGALRTRYRNGTQDAFLSPGEPVTLTVDLHDTAHTVRVGHRLRVQIAGACFPRRSRNLHTTTVPEFGRMDEAVVADHTVYYGHAHPSRLILRHDVV